MTTPADELRSAAARMREAAQGTTPAGGGWIGYAAEDGRAVIWGGPPDSPVWPAATVFELGYYEDCENCTRPSGPDLAWMMTATPALAEPLAAWLDEAARQYDLPPCDDPSGVCNRCEHDPSILAALAVARAVNGGAP